MLANLCHDDYSVIVKVKIATDVHATAEQHSMNQDGIFYTACLEAGDECVNAKHKMC